MSLVLSLLGVWLLALFGIVLAADVTRWWKCTTCGEWADYPAHYACAAHGGSCNLPYAHDYTKPDWPFVLVTVLMIIDGLAFVIVR